MPIASVLPRSASASTSPVTKCTFSRRSTSSTRPPGKTCMRGANAMVVARRMMNVSSPSSPSRSSTTVAAGLTGLLT